ncbi:hypothetical protein N7481_012851 [Penicillium waksmanii]|uniref:uncharacterized protein n=1 Tax=Penicillium waksmanii TaxID=69791 RepID=UPI00254904E6|nr:uncharacterized protein N7481_012851 [Penicillium waksmanii]KAJ5966137.1 hypothetical protein N7481_012851 [Penicillium waksmanii]
MSLRPTPNFTRWLTQPTRATTILRATQIQRPALRPFSLTSARSNTRTLPTKYTQPFQRPNPRSNQHQHQYQKRFNSTNNSNPNAQRPGQGQGQGHQQQQGSKEPSGLSARLRKLTREYGWAALGVYLTLSALDFPFCFAAVRLLGVERIGHFEHVILGYLKGVFGPIWPGSSSSPAEEGSEEKEKGEKEVEGDATLGADGTAIVSKAEEASIWTQLVFAYAIHKSLLIFVRVPLTAAVTPKVVKVLRRWGWDIGKRAPKST